MNKTEILNIVNEPSKHVKLMKIDGKDNIVYSAKFVELLELIPTMLTKADMIAILNNIIAEIQSLRNCSCSCSDGIIDDVESIIDKYIKSEA